ncbi:hypothetical protein TNCV_205101 [Trichonephila clavipes]|nr:hypothetical protein TNCV_205101 [Trichonephila clavipes]
MDKPNDLRTQLTGTEIKYPDNSTRLDHKGMELQPARTRSTCVVDNDAWSLDTRVGRLLYSSISNCVLLTTYSETLYAWTYYVLGYQLSPCVEPVLPYKVGQHPTSFRFDDARAFDSLPSTAGFLTFYPFCINTNDGGW